jgi:chromosome segregation ATPase
LQKYEEEKLEAQRFLDSERESFEAKLSEIEAASSKEIEDVRGKATNEIEGLHAQIFDLSSSLAKANALFEKRKEEDAATATAKAETSSFAATSAELAEARRAFNELEHYKQSLEKRLQDADAAIEQKDSVIKIMQDQLVMMANESMQGLDEAMKSKQVDVRPSTGALYISYTIWYVIAGC